jgi:hypothetical protein
MAIINVYAHEIQRGDYLQRPRDRGGHCSGSSYVQRVHQDGDTIRVTMASGVYDVTIPYDPFVPVWVERD